MQGVTGGDGLIDPDRFPARASDLDTVVIRGSAADIRAMGAATSDGTDQVASAWQGLTGCYQAPEQEQVYALMDPAVTSGHALSVAFGTAAGHLETYADVLEQHRARLAGVEDDARAFRARVIDGVQVDASGSKQAGFGDYVAYALDWFPGVDERKVTVPWYEDGVSVGRNKDLLARYGAVLADISTAAATCANAIQALVSGVPMVPVVAVPAQSLTGADGSPLPWGAAVQEDRSCAESVMHGGYEFGRGLWQGAESLVAGYNPGDGTLWSFAGYRQAWTGMVDLAGSLLVYSPMCWPVDLVAGGLYLAGETDNPFSKFMGDRLHTEARLTSLVGYDVDAKDGWHAWHQDAWSAGTQAVLNIGTFFIPVGGEAAAGLKGASVAARLVRIGELSADFVLPGGSWVIRGGIRIAGTLGDILRVGDRVLPTMQDVTQVGAKTVTLKPASLIALVDDVTAPRAPHTPVSDEVFDPHPPEAPERVEPGPAEPDPAGPAHDPTGATPVAPAHQPTEPAPVDPAHDPTGPSSDPSGHEPTGPSSDPTGPGSHPDTATPAGDHPAGSDGAGTDPAGSHHRPGSDHPGEAAPPNSHGDGTSADGTHGANAGEPNPPGHGIPQEYRDYPVQEVTAGQKGAWARQLYNLEPHTVYRIDDRHLFVTDDTGRVTRVETELTYRDQATAELFRNGNQQRLAGGEYRLDGDQGGHLIAASLGGPGEPINLVPMDRALNGNGANSFGALESQWRDILKANPDARVRVTIDVRYPDSLSARPEAFGAEWSVNGGEPEMRGFRQ